MSDQSSRRDRYLPLSTLAQLAEIVASLAVLATLVFLVMEVRQNTETTLAMSYDRSTERVTEWRLTVARDPELAGTFGAYARGDYTFESEAEDFRLQLLINTLWGIYENAYYAHERGLLGASEWSRFEGQICARSWPGASQLGGGKATVGRVT